MDYERLLKRLEHHEGFRSHVYKCSAGKWTIGYGRNVDPASGGGITEDEARILLGNDVARCVDFLNEMDSWFDTLDAVRQEVLVEMAFQLGIGGLLAKFPKTLAAIGRGAYIRAAEEMLLKNPPAPTPWSAWREQTPARCEELAEMMRTGEPQED